MIPALIAELGLAHDGSLWLAHSYIDACVDAGATHIKFQAHTALESSDQEAWRQPPPTGESRAAYWTRTAFSPAEYLGLRNHAHDRGVQWGLSLFHDSLVADLAPLCDFLKIPSGAVQYRALLSAIEAANTPTYISDGLHDLIDIPDPWVRLICTSQYPCPVGQAGINEIRPGIDGLSDHTGEPLTAALATYAGAVAVEVHVTFDRRTGLSDAKSSLTIDQLAEARRLMTLAAAAKQGQRPDCDPLMQAKYGYVQREGRWCKPAA